MKLFKYSSLTLFLFFCLTAYSQIKNIKNIDYNWRTDLSNTTVDISEVQAVLPRGTFPKLNFPKFINFQESKELFFEKEPVIAIEINSEARAYPLSILTVHEICNDEIGGVPVLAAYCPLCNTAVVFDRRLKTDIEEYWLEFEVSGMLRKSNLILYDFLTETWWQHLTGKAIAGDFAGRQLNYIPSMVISYKSFFERFPEGKIVSPETGSKHEKMYGANPYEYYDDIKGAPLAKFFKHTDINKRLPAMERVVDIKMNEKSKIYPFSTITEKGVINDQFENENIVIFHKSGTVSVLDDIVIRISRDIGSVTVFKRLINDKELTFIKTGEIITDEQTNSEWDITGLCTKGELKGSQLEAVIHGIHFAFAWLAFFPETEIYLE